MIYHIISKEKWASHKDNTYYFTSSIEREGYIHCSFDTQIMKVADTFYKSEKDLLILCINENKLDVEYKTEDLFNLNEKYPHVYGGIIIKSIEKIVELTLDKEGDFIKPNLDPISSLFVKQKEWT